VARAGKHVLVEKPLEIDLNRANALVEACDDAGVTLAVMLQHRLREAALGLRALIAAGELGQLVSAAPSCAGGGRKVITTSPAAAPWPATAAAC
jgi:UDP-N-acetyl-2-amino-2-deoxyglucuronate dehydrogenase